MLKVEVILKILEVNFGILVEVICPTSKSQGCLRESVLWGSPSPSTPLAIPGYYGALVSQVGIFSEPTPPISGHNVRFAWSGLTTAPCPSDDH